MNSSIESNGNSNKHRDILQPTATETLKLNTKRNSNNENQCIVDYNSKKDDSENINNLLLIVAVRCKNELRKIRIYNDDVHPSKTAQEAPSNGNRNVSGEDFYRILLDSMPDVVGSAKHPGSHLLHFPLVKLEIYDNVTAKFVLVDRSENDIVTRFGKKIMVCVLMDEIQGCNERLKIKGKFFPYDSSNIKIAGKSLALREIHNRDIGTGLNLWDGSLLLARYLEALPDHVKSKSVLELGSGCGLVGITAGFLGARDVVLTDLPYVMPLMKENVNTNMTKVQASLCVKIRCMTCDWFNPPGVDEFGFSLIGSEYSKFPDVILIADCVWVEHLVNPLLKTIDCLTDGHTEVIISYQRRGRTAHEALWCGLRTLFNSFEEVKMCDDLNLTKPDSLFLLRCRK